MRFGEWFDGTLFIFAKIQVQNQPRYSKIEVCHSTLHDNMLQLQHEEA
jgi:hypothetical protein